MMRTLSLVFAAYLLLGCGEQAPSNFEAGIATQTLHIANSEEPRELDPQLSTGSPESNIHMALSEGLTSKHPRTLAIQAGLAESWQISDDGLVYTFQLRKNARWSNGEALTAKDFVWSWRRSLMPNLASEWAYMKYFIAGAEAFHTGKASDFSNVGVKALNDHSLQVTLANPAEFFLQLLDHPSYFPVHPATILAHGAVDQAVSKWTRPENWVGNGPFALKEWSINKAIVVEKNPHYWDADTVKLNGIHFYPINDQQAEVRAFRSGQVHLTYSPQMAVEKIAFFKKTQPEALRITPTYATYFYEFNTTKPPFDNKLVRQALAHAVDRKLLVETVTKAGERPAYNLVPIDPEGYSPQQYFEFNPQKARALLAEAGYPNGEGFPTIEVFYNTQDNHRKMALAIQQMFAQHLNIQVTLHNQEWKVYLNTKRNLQHDIARAGWIADYLDPSNFFEILSSFSGNNDTGWKNEEYDTLMQTLKATSNPEQRLKLFEQANRILADEMPVLPIHYYSDINLVAPEVRGWHDNVMHYHPYKHVYLKANP